MFLSNFILLYRCLICAEIPDQMTYGAMLLGGKNLSVHLDGSCDGTPVDVDLVIFANRFIIPLANCLLDGMNSKQGTERVLVLKSKNALSPATE